MKAETVPMTPELALKLLENNTGNRQLSQYRVNSHVRAMREGRWIPESSAPVVVGLDGNLQQGQHRLWVTVESGHVWQAILITDAPAEARLYHDTGKPRSFRDYLKTQGVAEASQVAVVCRVGYHWDRGDLASRLIFSQARRENPADYADLWAWYGGHKDEIGAAMFLGRWLKRNLISRSAATVGALILSRISEDEAHGFYRQLAHREIPSPAAMKTIRALENLARYGTASGGQRGDLQHQLALLFKGWNYWRDGVDPDQVRWRSGGQAPESMPEPR